MYVRSNGTGLSLETLEKDVFILAMYEEGMQVDCIGVLGPNKDFIILEPEE